MEKSRHWQWRSKNADGLDSSVGLYSLTVIISPYSVAFGVILSLLFLFVCLYGWGYLNAGWCDRREILAQGRANIMNGNEIVWGLAAPGGRKKRQMKFSLLGVNGEFLHFGGFWAISQQRLHGSTPNIIYVGTMSADVPLPLWGPSAPGGRGEGELKTQKIRGGLIRA